MNEQRKPGRPPKVDKPEEKEPTVSMTQNQLESLMAKAAQAGREAALEVTQPDRLTRDQEIRAEDVHEPYDDIWEEPLLLDATHIQPRAKMQQRWMRTIIDGQADESNIARYLNKGWKPRQADSIPNDVAAPTIGGFRGYGSVVGVHGMVLMERDVELGNREKRAVRARTKAQLAAVDQSMMRDAPSGQGVVGARVDNRKSTITRGRAPSVPD